METSERRRIRAKLDGGVYTYMSNFVVKVSAIQQDSLSGVIVFTNTPDKVGNQVGDIVYPYNHDKYEDFVYSEEEAIQAYKKGKVKHAINTIKSCEIQMIKAKKVIEMYPEYAI